MVSHPFRKERGMDGASGDIGLMDSHISKSRCGAPDHIGEVQTGPSACYHSALI